ncbi:hypothetical protein MJO28_006764 [Puccinia striiformis f. sp. tritici]|uniref:Uncharacterized protein n=1 Tax=Puccinia striiformis f. sp. tritici TaxID=168172 RepID=A0ACC0EK31_9BASI|nr:hypothetical protein MJO28_006764 [Puccinia striiformis f. sp. tritici]KAI7958526.1 hypothetical protein MJO29_006743 [Puccinia striiformis f. sp. tritici]
MGSAGKEDNINSEDYLRGKQPYHSSPNSHFSPHRPQSDSLKSPHVRAVFRTNQSSHPRAFMNLVPFPLSETTRLENLHHRFKRACRNKDYQKLLRRESRKDLYLNTRAKVANLKQLIKKKFNIRSIVNHPRICLLKISDDSLPMKSLGTLPVPSPVAQGQVLPIPASADVQEDTELLGSLVEQLDLVFDPT